jgi:hypothetical protein
MAPKLPDDATWSARIAVCGLHCNPNRKSKIFIIEKNLNVSKSSDSTIPTVTTIAIMDDNFISMTNNRSTYSLALNSTVTVFIDNLSKVTDNPIATIIFKILFVYVRDEYLSTAGKKPLCSMTLVDTPLE